MKLSCISLAAFISQAYAYDPIAGYLPGTDVLDHGNMDLDQADMETAIKPKTVEDFAAGQVIYESGGNSKVVASLTVDALTADVSKKTVFSGVGQDGKVVTATAYADYTKDSTSIGLKYTPDTCTLSVTDGCFKESGEVTDGTTTYAYTSVDNAAKRTLRGFSTAVESKMSEERHAKYFKEYFGVYDYADKIVEAAFNGTATSMTNGNVDFTDIGFDGREQVVKKGTAYMHVFMYAIHEFEAAIVKCEGKPYDEENAVHAWDEGVAFHVGNLAGNTGAEDGKLVYAVGNKRCKDFGTCGASGTEKTGTAKVNLDLIAMFNRGRDELNNGDCDAAEATKNSIADAMYIPIIQGTLKYAYKGENDGGDEKAVAEGTAFAMSVLGRVYAASTSAASDIYNSMKTKATKISVEEVKSAFESVYDDLNLSCEDIGGLLQDDGNYYPGMEPCATLCTDKGRGKKGSFTDADSGLKMTCGQLGALRGTLKDEFCANGGALKCPLTCASVCGCNDDVTSGPCRNILMMAKGKRNRKCKNGGAKQCPDTCKGFCLNGAPLSGK